MVGVGWGWGGGGTCSDRDPCSRTVQRASEKPLYAKQHTYEELAIGKRAYLSKCPEVGEEGIPWASGLDLQADFYPHAK